ncbi:phosphoenolpyruvate--protein phosphotransferase [Ferrimonas gelatinilytica]|uniref:Phosphoenolpyruvate-protein phosphotransferase n=1 Tax=Ferrimonas gelatinilytica TaxID=1255257 RepID=A0ABP9S1D1_9GAMM
MSKVFSAIPISPGMALGQLHPCDSQSPPPAKAAELDLDTLLQQELSALDTLLLRQDLTPSERQLLEADRLLLDDGELRLEIHHRLDAGDALHSAIGQVLGEHADLLATLDDPQMLKRSRDVRSLGQRMARRSRGESLSLPQDLAENTILAVPELTAAEFIQLPKQHLSGLILAQGTSTDHLAILLRSAGLPGIVLEDACQRLCAGPVLLDGDAGQLTVATQASDQALFADAMTRWRQQQRHFDERLPQPAVTGDGERVWLFGNIGSDEEAALIPKTGLDGVGLLRTEFLYMAEGGWPSAERQYLLYRAIARQLEGRPLVIRSFDFGADKNLPGLALQEPNPALGVRAIRLGLQQPEHLKTQFEAVVRLAMEYPVKLLLPMVSLVEELHALRRVLDEVKQRLRMTPDLPLGMMVETPAAACCLELFAPYLDFASIGSNDLTQYCLAADRLNPRVSPHYPALSPPLLRILRYCCGTSLRHGLPLSLCGDLGADSRAIWLLLAMGLRQLSIPAGQSGPVKHLIHQYRHQQGRKLLEKALECDTCEQLNTLLNDCLAAGLSATIGSNFAPPS